MWSLVTTSAVRPRRGDPDQPDSVTGARPALGSSLVFAGVRAAGGAAGAGLAAMTILAVVGWIASPHPGLGLVGVLRTAGVLWLVGHHVAVQVQGAGRIGMLPLGLVLLPGTLLWWAGRAVIRGWVAVHGRSVSSARLVVSVALAVALPYSVIAGVLAVVSRSDLATASVPQAVLGGFAIAFAASWFGAARALASWRRLGQLMSARSRSILLGAAGSLTTLAAAGMLTVAVALANHLHQFSGVYGLLGPGLVGTGLLLLAQLAYLPNAVLWAIAYMLGPGFAVGSGTIVSPTGSVLGPMPAFPLLAALPSGPHGSVSGFLAAILLVFPYLAGAIGGLLIVRHVPHASIDTAAIRGFCGGACCGIVLGVLAAFAGGPLGNGLLSDVGPSAWQVGLVGALELGISAAICAGAASWWRGRATAQRGSEPLGGERDMGVTGTGPVPAPAATVSVPDLAAGAEEGGHVIYLDRWAEGQRSTGRSRPPSGPSALP